MAQGQTKLSASVVTDNQRAEFLSDYLDLFQSEFDETPLLMPLHSGKVPAIQGVCDLGTEQCKSMLVEPDTAVERVRDGAYGFAMYAGRSAHGTSDVVFVDHDDMDAFPTPTGEKTLTVRSGSGRGVHETYRNNGDVNNAKHDNSAGEVRANNWYVALPGSLHEDGGVYYVEENRPIKTLSDSDLWDEIRQSKSTKSKQTEKKSGSDVSIQYDEDEAAVVRQAVGDFRTDPYTTQRAFNNLIGLLQGEYSEWGHRSDRSSAEIDLASSLYGVLRYTGNDDNAIQRIYSYISKACGEYRWTDENELRKWAQRGDSYRKDVIQNAIETFDSSKWDKWKRNKGGAEWTDRPSDIVVEVIWDCVKARMDTSPGYPTRKEITDAADGLHGDCGEENYRKAMSTLRDEYCKVKMAYCGGNEYVWYPADEPDPASAEWVKIGGEKEEL